MDAVRNFIKRYERAREKSTHIKTTQNHAKRYERVDRIHAIYFKWPYGSDKPDGTRVATLLCTLCTVHFWCATTRVIFIRVFHHIKVIFKKKLLVEYCRTANFRVQEIFANFAKIGRLNLYFSNILENLLGANCLCAKFAKISCRKIFLFYSILANRLHMQVWTARLNTTFSDESGLSYE